MAISLKGMSASQLLLLRNEIDLRLSDMAKELEKQLVQIKRISVAGSM
jgi:hypothetical protein